MIHRIAIFAASLVATAGLVVGLVVAGFAPAPAPVNPGPVSDTVATTDSPAPVVQVDTVYVTPQATPQDIVVTKVVNGAHGGDDGNEGSDD
jgi:hypothetical protein